MSRFSNLSARFDAIDRKYFGTTSQKGGSRGLLEWATGLMDPGRELLTAIRKRQFKAAGYILDEHFSSGSGLLDVHCPEGNNVFHGLALCGERRLGGEFEELVAKVVSILNDRHLKRLLDEKNTAGDTPLHIAARKRGNDELGVYFLDLGADGSIPNANGDVVLDRAAGDDMDIAARPGHPGAALARLAEAFGKMLKPQAPIDLDSLVTPIAPTRRGASRAQRMPAVAPRDDEFGSDSEDHLRAYTSFYYSRQPPQMGGARTATSSRRRHFSLSSAEQSDLESENSDVASSDDEDGLYRDYKPEDNVLHEEAMAKIKKELGLGDDEDDQAQLRAAKATVWKQVKEEAEKAKEGGKPMSNHEKSLRLVELSNKKNLASLKKKIQETLKDMKEKAAERAAREASGEEQPRPKRGRKDSESSRSNGFSESSSSEDVKKKAKGRRAPKSESSSDDGASMSASSFEY
jgi:hypothetical protein